MTTEELLNELQEALGADLKSVILFGSAVAGDFVEGVSGKDLLIVAEKLGSAELAALSGPLGRWIKAGNPFPQLFTAAELAGSADVFPIELVDMQQARRVLAGDDPIAEIKIDRGHYRLQVERELKSRLHLLRRNYFACQGRASKLAGLMMASISTFLVLFRAALRLYDETAPPQKAAALEKLAQHVQVNEEPFLRVLELKQRRREPAPGEIESLFSAYIESIDKVVHAVDQHLHAANPERENSSGENP